MFLEIKIWKMKKTHEILKRYYKGQIKNIWNNISAHYFILITLIWIYHLIVLIYSLNQKYNI